MCRIHLQYHLNYEQIYHLYKMNSQIVLGNTQAISHNCRCVIEMMDAVLANQSTKDEENGADWWLKNYTTLTLLQWEVQWTPFVMAK